jgi:transcriptional regulator with XRE-family HTH domain
MMKRNKWEAEIELRKKHGWKQEYVAYHLGISKGCFQQYELGMTYPRLDTIRRLCEIYHVKADTLVFGKENKNAERN